MPLFLRGAQKSRFPNKKKPPGGKSKLSKNDGPQKAKKRKLAKDENVSSGSDPESDVEFSGKPFDSATSSEDERETAAEKRLRLAKEILAQIKEQEAQHIGEASTRDVVGERLNTDILEQTGKLRREVAHTYLPPTPVDVTVCRWRKLSVVTCIAITPDDRFVYCGTKDNSIVKWNVESGAKVYVIQGDRIDPKSDRKPTGHTDHVLCVAVSSDGNFLVSGGRDRLIHVWSPDTHKLLHTFQGHKAAVSGLVFQRGAHQLFSCSEDRSVKVWNLDEMAYVETLFGHEVGITGVDCLAQERVVTSGGRDGSVRLWKIIDESHLVFHGHASSIDCVCFIDDQHFFSGAEDNSLAVWGTMKKKPLMTIKDAHSGRVEGSKVKCWVTAVAALPHTDLLVSGSNDGLVRFWECGRECKFLKPLFSLPMEGYVNSLRFSSDGQFLVAGVGREHRLGRWHSQKNVKDSVCIIRLKRKTENGCRTKD